MRYFYVILSLIVTFMLHQPIADSDIFSNIQSGGVVTAAIDSPKAGQAVQGAVVIRGSNAVDGFQSYQVDFASTGDPTQAWFLIQEDTQPIQDGILAVWETTTLTDGDYNLRLLIYLTNGSTSAVTIGNIRVQNYAPVEAGRTSPSVMVVALEPGTTASTPIPQGTQQPKATPPPSTPAPLPTNPAEISAPQLMQTYGKGAAISVTVFVLVSAYLAVRTFLHGRK